jgi:hypothetical protein
LTVAKRALSGQLFTPLINKTKKEKEETKVIPESEHHLIQFAIIATPLALIIGGMVQQAVRQAVREQKQQSRVNHPTNRKGNK